MRGRGGEGSSGESVNVSWLKGKWCEGERGQVVSLQLCHS